MGEATPCANFEDKLNAFLTYARLINRLFKLAIRGTIDASCGEWAVRALEYAPSSEFFGSFIRALCVAGRRAPKGGARPIQ
jgi:hypothetical protein